MLNEVLGSLLPQDDLVRYINLSAIPIFHISDTRHSLSCRACRTFSIYRAGAEARAWKQDSIQRAELP